MRLIACSVIGCCVSEASWAAAQVGDLIESAKVVDGGQYLQSPSDN